MNRAHRDQPARCGAANVTMSPSSREIRRIDDDSVTAVQAAEHFNRVTEIRSQCHSGQAHVTLHIHDGD